MLFIFNNNATHYDLLHSLAIPRQFLTYANHHVITGCATVCESVFCCHFDISDTIYPILLRRIWDLLVGMSNRPQSGCFKQPNEYPINNRINWRHCCHYLWKMCSTLRFFSYFCAVWLNFSFLFSLIKLLKISNLTKFQLCFFTLET